MKVIQVKLEPTGSQITLLNKMIEEHRNLYNYALECKIVLYEEFDKQKLSGFDTIKEILPAVKHLDELKISNYSAAQQTLRRLDKAFNKFFRISGGFPRFKGRDKFKTIEYGRYGDGCKIKDDKLYLQNIGLIKALWYCEIKNIKTLSITKRSNGFYVNFIVDTIPEKFTPTGRSIGIDFGLKTFITTSDGDKYESPKYLKNSLKQVQKAHRKISRTELRSKKREKAKQILNKINTKISNQRKDFNHKLSRKIVDQNDYIFIENLSIKQLQAKSSGKSAVNRTYSDVAWGQFVTFLTYKAENAGKVMIKVSARNTTKECHRCGILIDKTLEERVHICSCGCIEDRDINAAKIILRRGLASLGLDESLNDRSPRIYSGE